MKTKTLFLSGLAICLSLLTTGAIAADDKKAKTNVDSDDVEFAEKAAMGGLLEVTLGELAEKQGSSEKVKELGKMMVTDHGKANAKLKSIAAQKNIDLPAALDSKHQKMVDKFSKLQGAEFDKEYVDAMVDDHEKDLSLFKKEADKGKDAELKAFAAETVPVIQQHLDHSKALKSELK